MKVGPLIVITIGLTLGLGIILSRSMRTVIAANWEKNRCEPSVVVGAAAFKPADDPRTPGQFAEDNWRHCQKDYVQKAIREAAALPREIANAEAAVVNGIQDIVGDVGDVFYDLWKFCYEAYSAFMDRMKGAAKLFHNFMIQLHNMVNRLQGSVISLVFGMVSLVTAFVDSVKVIVMVALIIIGIIMGMMILLLLFGQAWVVILAISLDVIVTVAAVEITKSMEAFTPGACFAPDTRIALRSTLTRSIGELRLGDELRDGGRVTAIHTFRTREPVYDLWGVEVSGDHLVLHPDDSKRLIPVSDHPDSLQKASGIWTSLRGGRTLLCLTTSSRRIPVLTPKEGIAMFADWEEIAEGDTDTLFAWNREVWDALNPGQAWRRPSATLLQAEAGLSPECHVRVPSWLGGPTAIAVSEVEVGDTVLDVDGRPTEVVGIVRIQGDQSTDACIVGAGLQTVSAATWIRRPGATQWTMAAHGGLGRTEFHPREWVHIYTTAGSFLLEDGTAVRDAADVGLENLRPLVDALVLGPSTTI
jgi:hypothetical protein